jgi:hypothetical protein
MTKLFYLWVCVLAIVAPAAYANSIKQDVDPQFSIFEPAIVGNFTFSDPLPLVGDQDLSGFKAGSAAVAVSDISLISSFDEDRSHHLVFHAPPPVISTPEASSRWMLLMALLVIFWSFRRQFTRRPSAINSSHQ